MSDRDYAHETAPESAQSSKKTIWIIAGIAAAVLAVCICAVCLVAASLIVLNRDGAVSPSPTPPGFDQEILNTQWQWSELIETHPANQSLMPEPQNYVVVFRPDGQVNVKADCNTVNGVYTIEGNNLTIQLGPMTMAECAPGSLHNHFVAYLGNVGAYYVEGGRLQLLLQNDAGRMLFENGGSIESGPDVPSSTPTPASGPAPEQTLPVGQPPEAVMSFPPEAVVGQQITFDGSQSQPSSSPIASYGWEFGDGNSAESAIATHSYSQAGTYEVKLTITGQDGLANTAGGQIVVKEVEAP